MDVRFRVTRRRVALLAAAAAAAATGSIGWAAVGDSGTIQGCVTNNGTIDAIDPTTQACRDRQTPVEWYTQAGADAAFLGATAKAADADKLDGVDSSGFLGVGAKAVDSDKLDGIDSTGFVNGRASYRRYWENSTIPAGNELTLLESHGIALVGLCTASSVQFEIRALTPASWTGAIVSSVTPSTSPSVPVVTQHAFGTQADNQRSVAGPVVKVEILAHSFRAGSMIAADAFGTIIPGFGTCKLIASGVISPN